MRIVYTKEELKRINSMSKEDLALLGFVVKSGILLNTINKFEEINKKKGKL